MNDFVSKNDSWFLTTFLLNTLFYKNTITLPEPQILVNGFIIELFIPRNADRLKLLLRTYSFFSKIHISSKTWKYLLSISRDIRINYIFTKKRVYWSNNYVLLRDFIYCCWPFLLFMLFILFSYLKKIFNNILLFFLS